MSTFIPFDMFKGSTIQDNLYPGSDVKILLGVLVLGAIILNCHTKKIEIVNHQQKWDTIGKIVNGYLELASALWKKNTLRAEIWENTRIIE